MTETLIMPMHLVCDGCGHGWQADTLEVVEPEPGAPLEAAEAVACPACNLVGPIAISPEIRRGTAWPTKGPTGRLGKRHGGRPTGRLHPLASD